jgi:hypothetical protein
MESCAAMQTLKPDNNTSDATKLARCWQRVDAKYTGLLKKRINKRYTDELEALNTTNKAKYLRFWWQVRLNHLLDWGDFLSQIGSYPDTDTLTLFRGLFAPYYIDDTVKTSDDVDKSARRPLRAAALDKYLEALSLLQITERTPKLGKEFAESVRQIAPRACKSTKDEIKRLLELIDPSETYYGTIQHYSANRVKFICGRPAV